MKIRNTLFSFGLLSMVIFVSVLFFTTSPIAAQGGMVIDAVDNDPDNKLWNCETNRVSFGDEQVDKSRCFSFRYQVPPEGISSATLHVSISTLGAMQETDSTIVAVGEFFSDCSWAAGGMTGCIAVHGGFEGPHKSLNLNLLDIACDPSIQGSPEKQQALIAQLQTGVLHFLLQDDTAVYSAKLVLNGGPPPAACGASEQPISETIPGGEQSPGGPGTGGSEQNSRCGLGQFWDVSDTNGTWSGVWTRRGDSNIFDGRWTQPGYQDIFAALTIQLDGSQVTVERQDIGDANNFGVTGCTYDGTLADDGVSVSGSATCATTSGQRTSPVTWSATIRCEPATGTSPIPGITLPMPPFGSPEPAAVGSMTLQAGQRRVVAGDFVYVPVWLIKGADVANINFSVNYNASVAVPEGDLLKGNLLDNALFSSNTGENGLIRAGFAQTSGVYGTGTVAYLPFRAVGQPGESTPLDIEISTINNPAGNILTIDRIDGTILIVGPNGLAPGDCDGDGSLTELDALCALQMSVQLISGRATLDMDGDNQVTSRDSAIILQRAIGK